MQKQIRLTDWHRWLLGESRWPFLLQVAARAALVYLLLLLAMRLLGKRVTAQMTLFEISVVVTLSAVIGIPLQVSDRGMLPAMLVVAVAILLQRGLALASLKKQKMEWLVSGRLELLVEDGRILLPALKSSALARERLFTALRSQNIWQLGQVRRFYLEPSGDFTLVRQNEPRPGLSLIPEGDRELRESTPVPGCFACGSCGHTEREERLANGPCRYCQHCQWVRAVSGVLD